MLEKQDNPHQDLVGFIWSVADKLRGPYRPPQYRRVMLPMIVLRRLDCVLELTKKKVLVEKERLEAKGLSGNALEIAISKAAVGEGRTQPFYNAFKFSLAEVLGDPDAIAQNLVGYINGFSPQIREIFEKFDFEKEIDKLNESNRLYLILKEFCNIDLSPTRILKPI